MVAYSILGMEEEDQIRGNNILYNLEYTKHLTAITSYNSSEQHYELVTVIASIFQMKQRYRGFETLSRAFQLVMAEPGLESRWVQTGFYPPCHDDAGLLGF